METGDLLKIVARGEDSHHQFKSDVRNAQSLAEEMVAFANSGGGLLIIGVSDDNTVRGLTDLDIQRINGLVSSAASQIVRPPIDPTTENVLTAQGLVLVVRIQDGTSKPYFDRDGRIWVKKGADKRKVTAREELQRMFQRSGLIHADEMPANGLGPGDIDLEYFSAFFERTYGERLEQQVQPLPQTLGNMNLCNDGVLNLSGALLFARTPQYRLPLYIVKVIAYPGTEPDPAVYLDSRDIVGKLADVFQQTLSFVLRNIGYHQDSQDVNSEGRPEIARIALEELIANSLIHRDYFVPAPVRLFVFSDRVEILSPGHLPNNLTVENIKRGNSNIRNPILASYATKLLPYRGLGNGVLRAIKEHPLTDLVDDREGNLFRVILWRNLAGATAGST